MTTTGTKHTTKTKKEEVVTEDFHVNAQEVVDKVKELVRAGNVRRIALRNEEGKTLLEIPLTVGVVGAALLPVWAAIGSVAALAANLTIVVERKKDEKKAEPVSVIETARENVAKTAGSAKKGVASSARVTKKNVDQAARTTKKSVDRVAKTTKRGVDRAAKVTKDSVSRVAEFTEAGLDRVAEISA